MNRFFLLSSLLLLFSGCASYHIARSAKLISQSDNIQKGEVIGTVRGEDCQNIILGIPIGEEPTVDALLLDLKKKNPSLRYINKMSVEPSRRYYVLFERMCYILKGVASK